MNAITWLLLICTALALVAFTWWGSMWWYGRKLGVLQQRLDKTREAATQHVGQARRQIAQLQKELVARPPLSELECSARDAAAAARSRRAALDLSLDQSRPSRLPSHGFADTQPL
ncbi:MAG: hypothetical protein H0W40_05180 [Methylibium sp.]|uniref:hypothetical protein n=1 Tax=Methylibium sp. TaxID=2067992 RepID=UPI0018184D37|nr:hypothetical protein [Methylibium sp.]MBA3596756.1 hypothetical protein [Methylibium sp.]